MVVKEPGTTEKLPRTPVALTLSKTLVISSSASGTKTTSASQITLPDLFRMDTIFWLELS